MDFAKLDGIARTLMLRRKAHHERETGFIYYHGARVAAGALALRAMLTDDASGDDILRAAGMFHDVGKGIGEHGETGALLAKKFLINEMTPEELDAVCELIRMHNRRGRKVEPITGILQDADILDHYGVQEIWMNFYYQAYNDESMDQSLRYYSEEFPRQIREHRKLLNYDCSKRIFDEKCAFVDSFVRRMDAEARGLYAFTPTP